MNYFAVYAALLAAVINARITSQRLRARARRAASALWLAGADVATVEAAAAEVRRTRGRRPGLEELVDAALAVAEWNERGGVGAARPEDCLPVTEVPAAVAGVLDEDEVRIYRGRKLWERLTALGAPEALKIRNELGGWPWAPDYVPRARRTTAAESSSPNLEDLTLGDTPDEPMTPRDNALATPIQGREVVGEPISIRDGIALFRAHLTALCRKGSQSSKLGCR